MYTAAWKIYDRFYFRTNQAIEILFVIRDVNSMSAITISLKLAMEYIMWHNYSHNYNVSANEKNIYNIYKNHFIINKKILI